MSATIRGGSRRRWFSGRTPRRIWAAALVAAVTSHGSIVLLGSCMRAPTLALPKLDASLVIDVEIVAEPLATEGGGGSSVPGASEIAVGDAELEPEVVARAAEPVRTPEPEAPMPATAERPVEDPTPTSSPFDVDGDWYQQDLLFAETDDSDPETFGVQARSAFSNVIRDPPSIRALNGSDPPKNSRYHGQGAGRFGGNGGLGMQHRPKTVEEAFAFGGPEGAFLGRMCYVPVGMRSLKALGACTTQLQFRTDVINIPPRRFEDGFPGIPDRIEWFSILYTGSFTVTKPGRYEFRVLSDDGSVLHINGRPVVDNDGLHEPRIKRGELELDAGSHRMELWYFQGPRVLIALQLFVTPPGKGERLFGPVL